MTTSDTEPMNEEDLAVLFMGDDDPSADAADAGEPPERCLRPGELSRAVETFFGPDTPLKRASGMGGRPYEERPQQLEMASAIAHALEAGEHLCVEAPTGVGKTFAYLVPAIRYALATGRKAIVSTHTISLQEQLVEKDLPLLRKLLDLDVSFAIAKGRGNYVCKRRLAAAAGDSREYLPSAELLPEVERLRAWAETSRDGSRSSLPQDPDPAVWESVCCEVGNCLNAKCEYFAQCFMIRARNRLMKADVIVANHAIFFIDLAMKLAAMAGEGGGLLPEYGVAVLDEGHCIEDTAAENLGVRVSFHSLRRTLRRLYNPERNRGLLTDSMYTEARLAVIKALDHSERFFSRLYEWAEQQEDNPLRYTSPGHVPDLLGGPLEEAAGKVAAAAREEQDDSIKLELGSLAERIREARQAVHTVLEMTLPDHVYWFERYGMRQTGISLNAVPIDVASLLDKNLFSDDFSVIVTSATLSVRGSLDYFRKRIGAHSAKTLTVSSPFNFQEQVTLHVPSSMPNPKDLDSFMPAAAEAIKKYVRQTHGKAFVLFTSYLMMQEMAAALAEFFAELKIRLLVQGEGVPRTRMLEQFREDIDSVIFGTASFWTGVDVPGEALCNVIIVRLPFAVPDHPLVAARQEQIEREGRNAFYEYSLPEAILRFRQGCGRLIRSRADKGIIVVLDNRVLTTRYGRGFLESIPQCPVITDG